MYFRNLSLIQYYCIDVMCVSGFAAAFALYMIAKITLTLLHSFSDLKVRKVKIA